MMLCTLHRVRNRLTVPRVMAGRPFERHRWVRLDVGALVI